MSDFVPPTATDFQPPTPRPASAWPGSVAWAFIWIATAFLLISTMMPELRGKKSGSPSASSQMQMELLVKYAIGMRQLTGAPVGQLVKELEKLAKTPEDRLKIAIASGELISSDTAITTLEKLDADQLTDELKQDRANLVTIYTTGPGTLDESAKQRLIARHGKFGKLALSFMQPASDPVRQQLISQGRRTVIALFTAFGLGSILALTGLVLLIIAIVMRIAGRLTSSYRRDPGVGTVYVEMFAIYLVSFILLAVAISFAFKGRSSLSISWLLSVVLPLAIAWGMFRGQSWSDIKQALGWHSGRGLSVEVPLGLVGYVAGLPVLIFGFLITYLLLAFSGVTPSHPIQGEAVSSSLDALQLYAIACIWAPVIEETMFRGALFHHLRGRWNWLISSSVVAFIFAAIHPQGWTFIPVLGAIAIVLAALREWRGSIIPSMVAHACSNFMMVSLLIAVK